jgi:hypothetical protein
MMVSGVLAHVRQGRPEASWEFDAPFLLVIYIWASVIDARCAWGSGMHALGKLRFERRFDEIFRSINCKCIEE